MMEKNVSANARIIDRGYQHYEGERLGLAHSEWAMLGAALKRGVGLRRSFRHKIMPWLLIAVAFLPPVVILGFQIIAGQPVPNPYTRIYPRIVFVFVLFAGLVASDLLCADRRERVISLYFSAPITRLHYIASQVLSLVLLLLLLTLVPYVILFFGQALLAPAFSTFVSDNLSDLWHLLITGVLLAFFFGTLAMAVAAFTDRRAYATGGFLGLVLVSSVAGGILSGSERIQFSGHEWFSLIDLLDLPIRVMYWLFGGLQRALLVDGSNYLWATLAVIVISLALVAWRYLKVSD
jgi:ABC-type transport system involved in multi-copper enzyme maturation permease subunit